MPKIIYNGLEIRVDSEVYKPADDSFLLADNLEVKINDKVLELGTGTGFLSILAAKKGASQIIATDITDKALKCAEKNIEKENLAKKIELRKGNLFDPVKNEKFDLIIFNPPYLPTRKKDSIESDLELAWNGGTDGRKVINRFIENLESHLEKDGRFFLIQSSLSGIEETTNKLEEKNFEIRKKSEKYSFEKLYLIKGRKK